MSNPPAQTKPRQKFGVINYPAANQAVLVEKYVPATMTGALLVRYNRDNQLVTQVIGCLQAGSGSCPMPAQIPNPLPAGYFNLPQVTTTNTFANPASPVTGLPSTPPTANNMTVTVGGYDANGNLVPNETHTTAFVAVPGVLTFSVQATHCLWLVYAAPGTALPQFGETAGAPYLPTPLLVPDGAKNVQVSVVSPPAPSWRHDPDSSQASGPEGLPNTEQTLDPAYAAGYQNAGLKSMYIAGGKYRLNRLVGLWVYADPTVPTAELDVIQTPQFAIPTGPPVSLCLGFHDGYQWANNSGSVPVQVTWS